MNEARVLQDERNNYFNWRHKAAIDYAMQYEGEKRLVAYNAFIKGAQWVVEQRFIDLAARQAYADAAEVKQLERGEK